MATAPIVTSLIPAQESALRTDIQNDIVLNAIPKTADGAFQIASVYNQIFSPSYWVWRTSVSHQEVVSTTTVPDNTAWSWTAYINRSQGERDAWDRMFSASVVDFSLANVQQAIADIFSGGGAPAVAQRAHILIVARRLATRAERLFATGFGTTVAPSKLVFEGQLTYRDVASALGI